MLSDLADLAHWPRIQKTLYAGNFQKDKSKGGYEGAGFHTKYSRRSAQSSPVQSGFSLFGETRKLCLCVCAQQIKVTGLSVAVASLTSIRSQK